GSELVLEPLDVERVLGLEDQLVVGGRDRGRARDPGIEAVLGYRGARDLLDARPELGRGQLHRPSGTSCRTRPSDPPGTPSGAPSTGRSGLDDGASWWRNGSIGRCGLYGAGGGRKGPFLVRAPKLSRGCGKVKRPLRGAGAAPFRAHGAAVR